MWCLCCEWRLACSPRLCWGSSNWRNQSIWLEMQRWLASEYTAEFTSLCLCRGLPRTLASQYMDVIWHRVALQRPQNQLISSEMSHQVWPTVVHSTGSGGLFWFYTSPYCYDSCLSAACGIWHVVWYCAVLWWASTKNNKINYLAIFVQLFCNFSYFLYSSKQFRTFERHNK